VKQQIKTSWGTNANSIFRLLPHPLGYLPLYRQGWIRTSIFKLP
jgi:hypothetical protein